MQGQSDIYALGDCATIEGFPLPATAQVAQQQGRYLARELNAIAAGRSVQQFEYRSLGMLAYVGNSRALADLEAYKGMGVGDLALLAVGIHHAHHEREEQSARAL